MAKRKKAQPWDAVFDRVRCIWQPYQVYEPTTTAAELDAVEAALDFKFPLSYRAFAEQFGLNGNVINTLPRLLPLQKPIADGWSVLGETLDLRATYRDYWWVGTNPSPLFDRMVIFAEDGGYYKFVFDPAEVTDPNGREYGVYCIDKSADITAAGTSFPEFLDWLYDKYRPDPEELDEEEESRARIWTIAKPNPSRSDAINYERLWGRDKQSSEPESVKLWLAWNNDTARDLARSIRDRGQTDAFPILADALQEAGCDNPDLLDSCRTGDPDIDGKWVLRVLLGES